MSTKKKVVAKAAVKATPVRRHKPGPAERAKRREARREAAALAETKPEATNTVSGRVRVGTAAAHDESDYEMQRRWLRAQTEALELANKKAAQELGINYAKGLEGMYDRAAASEAGAEPTRTVSAPTPSLNMMSEQDELEQCQHHTRFLVDELHERMSSLLRTAYPKDERAGGAESGRDRSGLAGWVADKTEQQRRINLVLQDLLTRLDLP